MPDGSDWYQSAQAAREANDYPAAHEALKMAERLEFSPVRISFERARLHTLVAEPLNALVLKTSIGL